jgi:hypothetical protein
MSTTIRFLSVRARIPKRSFTDHFAVNNFWHKPLRVHSEGQRNGNDASGKRRSSHAHR